MRMSGATAPSGGGGLGLHRARLLQRLAYADVAVLVAPAGSGKTQLLQQFSAGCEGQVAWCRTDPDDMDAERFTTRLRAALAAGPRTLLVDDFHFVVGGPAESAFERVVLAGSAAADRVRVVLGTRVRPTVNLVRAELGRVTMLSGDDMRFRCWEVEALFADCYGRPLPPEDAAALSRHTDGWAAGLHLFHLATQALGARDRRAAIHALSGRSRYLRGYLARTVLGELPPELCEFLRRTHVFETVTARRCDLLLGRTDSGALLAELDRRQAMTSSDDDGHSYRYHEVLRHHLAAALREQLGTAEAARWCARAAAQLEQEAAHAEAARLFARAERWTDVARLLQEHGDRVAGDRHSPVWCEGLPATVVDDDPWLSTATARREVAAGRLHRASLRYRHAEQLFTEPGLRDAVARERRLVDIWLDAPARPELHWVDRLRAATIRYPLDYVTDEIDCRGEAFAQAGALLLAGYVYRAYHRAQAADSGAPLLLDLWTQFVGAVAALVCGDDVTTRIEHLAGDAEQGGAIMLVRLCRALSTLGAPRRCTEVADECDAVGDRWGAASAIAIAACRELLAGEPSAAIWRMADERYAALRADTARAWVLAFEAIAALVESRPGAVAMLTRAERFARTTGVPGAQVIALLGASGLPGDAGVGRLAAARTLAAEIGMPWPRVLAERVLRSEPATADPPPTPAAAPRLRLRCLGTFEVEVDGVALDCQTLRPRAAATLRYLAMRAGRAVHREDLVAALWPDLTAERARQNLQVTVSAVRHFLEPTSGRGKSALLVRQGETYSIALPGDSSADVVAFTAAVDAAQCALRLGDDAAAHRALTAALAEYRGDLLPADGAAEWVVSERDRLRTQASLAGAALAELELRGGEPAAAIQALQHSLRIDPYLDRAWRLLIAAYDHAGDLAAAQHARRDYARVLDELGVDAAQPLTAAAAPARTVRSPGAATRQHARSVTG
ncbi:BTAD domain-containing putative transcriptional regulator [Nocardia sp. NPDC057455]|uniref:BTAD domain-containing putative transcriptional regulator n=1 Tax=Nocardia sp. NPDC057455 TaxID=3346138 RepID=UPI00366EE4EC